MYRYIHTVEYIVLAVSVHIDNFGILNIAFNFLF